MCVQYETRLKVNSGSAFLADECITSAQNAAVGLGELDRQQPQRQRPARRTVLCVLSSTATANWMAPWVPSGRGQWPPCGPTDGALCVGRCSDVWLRAHSNAVSRGLSRMCCRRRAALMCQLSPPVNYCLALHILGGTPAHHKQRQHTQRNLKAALSLKVYGQYFRIARPLTQVDQHPQAGYEVSTARISAQV